MFISLLAFQNLIPELPKPDEYSDCNDITSSLEQTLSLGELEACAVTLSHMQRMIMRSHMQWNDEELSQLEAQKKC